jgi:Tat protein secretion system quality control protein TatD with DNase activity
VALTAARLAEIRGMTFTQFAQITTANARSLFSLSETNVL